MGNTRADEKEPNATQLVAQVRIPAKVEEKTGTDQKFLLERMQRRTIRNKHAAKSLRLSVVGLVARAMTFIVYISESYTSSYRFNIHHKKTVSSQNLCMSMPRKGYAKAIRQAKTIIALAGPQEGCHQLLITTLLGKTISPICSVFPSTVSFTLTIKP